MVSSTLTDFDSTHNFPSLNFRRNRSNFLGLSLQFRDFGEFLLLASSVSKVYGKQAIISSQVSLDYDDR